MYCDLHHLHPFASDLKTSLRFCGEMFGVEVFFDETVAGVRNAMIQISTGRINFYDQPLLGIGFGPVHHLGIYTEDIFMGWSVTWRQRDLNFGIRLGMSQS
jgi:hypothetical protein